MSGPMSLEPGGAEQDTLALRLADDRTLALRLGDDRTLALRLGDDRTLALRLADLNPGATVLPRRRVQADAVDELAAALADRVAPAVHSYEVAALLESEGLTGDVIREKYGHDDLFSLATAVFRRVPRTFPEPPRPKDPWRPDHLRCALRGLLFALPGLAYALVGRLLPAEGTVRALVVAGLISWAWNQALGHRAYLRLATGRREAGRTLAKGAPLGAAVASAAGAALAGSGVTALVVTVQSAYLAAAGVLLVLGRERLLLAALLPVAAGGASLLWWEPGNVLRAGLPLLSLLGAVAAAGWALRAAIAAPAASGAARPGLWLSLPYGLFGLAAGSLAFLAGRDQPWAVIVLTLSMGPAEWLLYRYRGLSVAALRSARTLGGFRFRSCAVLAGCLLVYLGPLVPAAMLANAEPASLLLLAGTLWISLLLQAFGTAWPAAVVCLGAAGFAGAEILTDASSGTTALPLSCGAALLCLIAVAVRKLGRPAAHG
ncbi:MULTISPECIES: hypothetical protein [unclassified Streptomyces]|uniref:hypothetical protein n=1 Tax=unclassified Streptomyces TaxID=2593676 RepID=UPI000DADF373|nr:MULTISPECIES: hypothetical protein [unclassified Streptomyces]PZT77278.1 hypothetical protein DNK56_29160 [Streptomyces sp. AC1-42W]PZT78770.1 hypothetical protein DNK55_03520 [Streptomyces sp. AC1-42T]